MVVSAAADLSMDTKIGAASKISPSDIQRCLWPELLLGRTEGFWSETLTRRRNFVSPINGIQARKLFGPIMLSETSHQALSLISTDICIRNNDARWWFWWPARWIAICGIFISISFSVLHSCMSKCIFVFIPNPNTFSPTIPSMKLGLDALRRLVECPRRLEAQHGHRPRRCLLRLRGHLFHQFRQGGTTDRPLQAHSQSDVVQACQGG